MNAETQLAEFDFEAALRELGPEPRVSELPPSDSFDYDAALAEIGGLETVEPEVNGRSIQFDFEAALRELKEVEPPQPEMPAPLTADFQPTPLPADARQEWEEKPNDEKNDLLWKWWKIRDEKGRDAISDRQQQLLIDYNFGSGKKYEAPAEETEVVEERAKDGLARWLDRFDWKGNFKKGAKGVAFTATGFGLGEVLHLGPETEGSLAGGLFFVNRVINRFGGPEGIQRFIDARKRKYPRFYNRVLGRVVEAELKAIKTLGRSEVVLVALGLLGHSAYEQISGEESVFHRAQATEPTEVTEQVTKPSETPTAERATDLPKPTEQPSGMSESAKPPEAAKPTEPPRPAEQPAPDTKPSIGREHRPPVRPRRPTPPWRPAEVSPPPTFDVSALQQGPTIGELATQMPKGTMHEAVYRMIGDVPHRGEVTNALTRGFQTAGVDMGSLHEGTVREAAGKIVELFTSPNGIDAVVSNAGIPYTEGGRGVVEAMKGANSPEARLIRAANMNDLEAARGLFDQVLRSVIEAAMGK